MERGRRLRRSVSVAAACATLFATHAAQARDCSAGADCPRGFECIASDPTAGPAGTCASLSCQSDSDCASSFRCDIGFGAGNSCAPQWQVPCLTETDCGPGFTCMSTFGGSYNCGKGQDAAVPPYEKAMPIACGDIPRPPDPCSLSDASCPFAIPSICDAGSMCTAVTWKSCEATQTGPCSVDSDCPSTWTCQCPSSAGNPGGPPSPPPGAGDAGCTKRCVAPNSDLSNGGSEGPGFGGSLPVGVPLGDAGAASSTPDAAAGSGANGASPGGAGSASKGSDGGCGVDATNPTTDAAYGALLALCGASWMRRRSRRAR
jgi:hypothetical protein